jgi:hypothetical protein
MNHSRAIVTGACSVLFAASAIAVFGLLGAPAAHAANCGITAGSIDQITAIQNDPSLSPSDEIKRELALRKILVGETIVCAEQEEQTFQANLATTTVPSDVQSLKSQLLGNLRESANFYSSEMAQLNVVGVAGTKAVAQQVFAWRQSSFLPLGENVNNFILWAQNQNLFNTAQVRMNQTQSAVSFLENASPNADLETAFNNAQSSFNDAQTENVAAKTALIQNLSADQSLVLIKQSLASLSDTYQGFSDVSTAISKILPQ